jgi:mannose-6-phosphate isomerase-like protein (cupin superfamily)
MEKAINIKEKFQLINEHWSPGIIAQMNDYHFKIAKIKGEFIWHSHADTDEVFMVMEGNMEIHLREQIIALHEGEMYVIKKGLEHKPFAANECSILMIERAGTLNTGDAGGEKTVTDVPWL